jgi:hypothetical protein
MMTLMVMNWLRNRLLCKHGDEYSASIKDDFVTS